MQQPGTPVIGYHIEHRIADDVIVLLLDVSVILISRRCSPLRWIGLYVIYIDAVLSHPLCTYAKTAARIKHFNRAISRFSLNPLAEFLIRTQRILHLRGMTPVTIGLLVQPPTTILGIQFSTRAITHIRFHRRIVTIIALGILCLICIQYAIRNLCRLVCIVQFLCKNHAVISLGLYLIRHAFLIHDAPQLVLRICKCIIPTCDLLICFVKRIVVHKIHRTSDIQEARYYICLTSTYFGCIARIRLRKLFIRRKKMPFCHNSALHPDCITTSLMSLKGIEIHTTSMIYHHRFAVLIYNLGRILRLTLPVSKPSLEIFCAYRDPFICRQTCCPTVRRFHIRAGLLGRCYYRLPLGFSANALNFFSRNIRILKFFHYLCSSFKDTLIYFLLNRL